MRPSPAALTVAFLVVQMAPAGAARAQEADFLFSRPNLTLAVMGGWARPGEGSDLFDFTRDELTVKKGDFASPLVLVEAAARVTERLDVSLAFEHTQRTVGSAMREWVTQDDRPINQATLFRRRRLMASVKGYLFPRGRRISEYAWVPSAWSPYAGVGAGWTWFLFRQEGDWVDYQTLDIFTDQFQTSGRGGTAHVLAGVDVSVSARFLVRGEYRYIWGRASMDDGEDTFVGFGDVDLSGSRASLGLAVRI